MVGHHSYVVSSAPTILWSWVRIPSTLFKLYSICIIEIVMKKGQSKLKEARIGRFKKTKTNIPLMGYLYFDASLEISFL